MLFLSRHALVLFTGVVCLELFIQYNWTGPTPPQSACMLPSPGEESSNQLILERLSEDGQVQSQLEMLCIFRRC